MGIWLGSLNNPNGMVNSDTRIVKTESKTTNQYDRLSPIVLGLAAFYFLLEWIPPTLGEYGYFVDEFYYLACTDHLALGYVDHPPLSIFLLWLIRHLFGDSLLAIRFLPALIGGISLLLVGDIARRLNANRLGQIFAVGAAMTAMLYQILFSFYSMNALSILFWALGFWILVRIETENRPKLWLLFGLIVGLGLLNKHTFILLPLGLLVGLLLTPARRHLGSRWLWLGSAVAFLLILPNLIWQAFNGWPSIEFYANAVIYKNVPTPPHEILFNQILGTNPGTLIVWLSGLGFLLFSKRGRPFRHLGWIYLTLLVMMIISQSSRPDRIADVYLILFATGGLFLSELSERRSWIKWALPLLLAVSFIAFAPLALPLLPINQAADYSATLGVTPRLERSEGETPQLPLWLAYRIGWEEYVNKVAIAVDQLSADERRQTVIIAPTYSQAGAIELLGRGRHFPTVYSMQNSYFHWRQPPDSIPTAIATGPITEEMIGEFYRDIELVATARCDQCSQWRAEVPIWIARDPIASLKEAWPKLRFYQ